jgi:hypothetical protein
LALPEVVFEHKLVQVVVNHAFTRPLESLLWPDVGGRSEKLVMPLLLVGFEVIFTLAATLRLMNDMMEC